MATEGSKAKSKHQLPTGIEELSPLPPRTACGGGSQRSLSETFLFNALNGTMSLAIPIRTSPGRSGETASLTLNYDSGSGNGPFGLGWNISMGAIRRKTGGDHGVPRYNEGDVFQIEGMEDLLPVLSPVVNESHDQDKEPRFEKRRSGDYVVQRYRTRIDKNISRIECWTNVTNSGDVHWRVTSGGGVATIYGRDDRSRIMDGSTKRIFSWLACETYDLFGNHSVFDYKAEDSEGIDAGSPDEQNRNEEVLSAQKYLKSIKYGNKWPNRSLDTWEVLSPESVEMQREEFMFEMVLDYGEHTSEGYPTTEMVKPWALRKDAFSTYRSGFEIRTRRLCNRFLMFHHMAEELGGVRDCLVSTLTLRYDLAGTMALLTTASETRHRLNGHGGYEDEFLPLINFEYSSAPDLSDAQIAKLDASSILRLPGLNGARSQWVDLDSEGLPGILTSVSTAYYYHRNIGRDLSETGKLLESPRLLRTSPCQAESRAIAFFEDLDGSGGVNLLVVNPKAGVCGFFKRAENDGWSEFIAFKSFPPIDLSDPGLNRIDLTGDGIADILNSVDEDGEVVWYPSLGVEGFGAQIRTANLHKPALVRGDAREGYFLADMSGDGLADIVRIRNGDILYWPNIGYGNFGARVCMNNAPLLDLTDQFSPEKLRLFDIDGSGTTDVVYLPSGGTAHIYFNLSGNGWSPRQVIGAFPATVQTSSVQVIDLLGTGTGCLSWISIEPSGEANICYIDLINGTKPYLLTAYSNGMGLKRDITYAPSTKYYCEDKRRNKPWQTKLPFPIYCIDQIITTDKTTQYWLKSRYAYHDGYYDGVDHEFRGFGMVEQWDIERLAGGADFKYQRPAIHRKRWFHTGAAKHTYALYDTFQGSTLPPSQIPEGLSSVESCQAHRALKGSLLREEIYSDDGSSKAVVPYSTKELNYIVQIVQRHEHKIQPAFCVRSREIRTINYERNIKDPRIEHNFALQVDKFGNILKSATISYGRIGSPLAGENDRQKQEESVMTWVEQDYTNSIDEGEYFRTPLAAGLRRYRILGMEATKKKTFQSLVQNDFEFFKQAKEIPPTSNPVADPSKTQKLLLSEQRSIYRSSDLSRTLSYQYMEVFSVLAQTYQLAFPVTLVKELLNQVSEQLLSQRLMDDTLQSAGYVQLENIPDKWWTQSSCSMFSRSSNAELNEARQNFYRSTVAVDPFGNKTYEELDKYKLFPICRIDPIGNETRTKYDYNALQARLIEDCNGNRRESLISAAANVAAYAVMGKKTEKLGDLVEGLDSTPSIEKMDEFIHDPIGLAADFLGCATWRRVLDLSRYHRTGLPCYEAVLSRDTHCSSSNAPPNQTKISIRVVYLDGYGRCFQTAELREASKALSWRVSSPGLMGCKGQVVAELLPLFAPDHRCIRLEDPSWRIQSRIFRDPYDRVIGVLRADRSWRKTRFDSWSRTDFDEGTTLLASDVPMDPDIGSFFKESEKSAYLPSWHDGRLQGGDEWEKDAASKSARYANCPKVHHLNPLGQVFLSAVSNGADDITTRINFDLYGRQCDYLDALCRTVYRQRLDFLSRPLKKENMEKDTEFTLLDVQGQRVLSYRGRNVRWRITYDALRRPLASYVQKEGAPEIVLEKMVYGEVAQNPESRNLRGQVVQLYDQSGIKTNTSFDFKGNCATSETQLAAEFKTEIDWSDPGAVNLESAIYTHSSKFNAYNRDYCSILLDGSIVLREYDLLGLEKAVKAQLATGSSDTFKPFVSDTLYSAQGQKASIKYGNGSQTDYEYDPASQRLKRVKTTGPSGTVLLDIIYVYDVRGRITSMRNIVKHGDFFLNERKPLVCTFLYDNLGQLTRAGGRELLDSNPDGRVTLVPTVNVQHVIPADGNCLSEYSETYKYDPAGNMLVLAHSLSSEEATSEWTRKYEYNEPSFIDSGHMSNRLSRTLTNSTVESYAYEQGYMSSLGDFSSLRWNSKDMLRSVTSEKKADRFLGTTWFVYDMANSRIRKEIERPLTPGGASIRTESTISFPSLHIRQNFASDGITVASSQTLVHIRGDDLVAIAESDEHNNVLVRYRLNNGLELDGNGDVISYEEYTPFGVSALRVCRADSQIPGKYRYWNYERDKETGLDYCGARYYASNLARWTAPDPADIRAGLNLFAYCHNDPINFQDPYGMAPTRRGGMMRLRRYHPYPERQNPLRQRAHPAANNALFPIPQHQPGVLHPAPAEHLGHNPSPVPVPNVAPEIGPAAGAVGPGPGFVHSPMPVFPIPQHPPGILHPVLAEHLGHDPGPDVGLDIGPGAGAVGPGLGFVHNPMPIFPIPQHPPGILQPVLAEHLGHDPGPDVGLDIDPMPVFPIPQHPPGILHPVLAELLGPDPSPDVGPDIGLDADAVGPGPDVVHSPMDAIEYLGNSPPPRNPSHQPS